MQGKYSPGQTVYLSGANKGLIEEAVVLKYTSGLMTPKSALSAEELILPREGSLDHERDCYQAVEG